MGDRALTDGRGNTNMRGKKGSRVDPALQNWN